MHGLSPHDEIDYWRERATKAETVLEAIRDELMAANLAVATTDTVTSLAHHVFVLRISLAEVSDQLDNERQRLAAANAEIERLMTRVFDLQVECGLRQLGEENLLADLVDMTAARDEACDLAMNCASDGWRDSDTFDAHIDALRKVGGDK
jgi:hypothetical protein